MLANEEGEESGRGRRWVSSYEAFTTYDNLDREHNFANYTNLLLDLVRYELLGEISVTAVQIAHNANPDSNSRYKYSTRIGDAGSHRDAGLSIRSSDMKAYAGLYVAERRV